MLSCLPAILFAWVLAESPCALGQLVATFNSASASSDHPGGFVAEEALATGPGYWCSSGNHAPGQRVTWTGVASLPQETVGVSINWAYGPGEFRILTSADGGNFEEAAGWRLPTRADVSYTEVVMFEAPRRVKALAIVMRSPKPWGYFGINDISLLVKPGASMLVSGELCLVVDGDNLAVHRCLDTIAGGSGHEVFSLSHRSQLVSGSTGKCIAIGNGGFVAMQDCEDAADAGDGHSTFSVTPAGQVQGTTGKYCLAATPAGAFAVVCSGAEGEVLLYAVPAFDPAPAAHARDTAALLRAAGARQATLLETLKGRIANMGGCKALVQGDVKQARAALAATSKTALQGKAEPAVEISSKIVARLNIDLEALKGLISESQATLASVA